MEYFFQLPTEVAIERIAQRVFQLQQQALPAPVVAQSNMEAPITSEVVCELLQISRKTLNDWRTEGIIPFYRKGKRVYFFRSEVLASLEAPKRLGRKGGKLISLRSTADEKQAA